MSGETLSLTSLEVQNVLRLKAVKLTLDPKGALILEGRNQQGKSSVLKALEMVLAGMDATPDAPLHGKAKKGHIIARFGDLQVEKTFREGKRPVLTVTTAEGARMQKPQTILNKLLDHVSLDPLKFMQMPDKAKAEALAVLMGFDAKPYDEEIRRIFDCRTDANREAKRLAAVAEAATHHPDAPAEEVKVADLVAELKKREAHNAECEKRRQDAEDKLEDKNRTEGMISVYERKVTELLEDIERARDVVEEAKKDAKIAHSAWEIADGMSHSDQRMDAGQMHQRIEQADLINRNVRANIEAAKAIKEAAAAKVDAEGYNTALDAEKLKKETARLAARDKLPVPDLDVTEDGVLYKGKPLSQAGSSAQLHVSVSVAIAANKDKRIQFLGIDDGEKLDGEGVEIVMGMAREAGFQVLMTRVIRTLGDASKGSIVIEDGEVKDG